MLLLGHRGARASRHIPENTLASFELSIAHGCDGFEFDVRRSADSAAVICHDETVRGMKIAQRASKDLELPVLEQVLQQFASRAWMDIELKVTGLEHLTLAALHAFPPQNGFLISSFLPEVLQAMNTLDSTVPLGMLCESMGQLQNWRQSPAEWVIPHIDLVNAARVKEFHSAGKKVMVWTVNRATDMHRLANCGVQALISDDTELLVHTLRS